jgi:hypothetical protein
MYGRARHPATIHDAPSSLLCTFHRDSFRAAGAVVVAEVGLPRSDVPFSESEIDA